MKPEKRTELALRALNWQGGTVHQICNEFCISVNDFLYSSLSNDFEGNNEFITGWYGIRTCSQDHFKNVLIPKYKGSLMFVFGALAGLNVK